MSSRWHMSAAFRRSSWIDGLAAGQLEGPGDRNDDFSFLPDPVRFLRKPGLRRTELKSRLHETAYLNPAADDSL